MAVPVGLPDEDAERKAKSFFSKQHYDGGLDRAHLPSPVPDRQQPSTPAWLGWLRIMSGVQSEAHFTCIEVLLVKGAFIGHLWNWRAGHVGLLLMATPAWVLTLLGLMVPCPCFIVSLLGFLTIVVRQGRPALLRSHLLSLVEHCGPREGSLDSSFKERIGGHLTQCSHFLLKWHIDL